MKRLEGFEVDHLLIRHTLRITKTPCELLAVHDSGLIVGSTGVYRDFIVVTQCVGSQLRLVCGADLSGTCCRFQLLRIASLKDENAVEIPSGSPYLIAGRALSAGSLCIDESNSF
jgi:hypothetical protein